MRPGIVALTLCLAACASPPPGGLAHVRVDVLRGFDAPPVVEAPNARLLLLLDVTRSMAEPTDLGPPRHEAAREAASRLALRMPPGTDTRLYALGAERVSECQAVRRVPLASAAQLAEQLERLPVAGEGSLAASLVRLRGELPSPSAGARVVAFTDLGEECGGDLCQAAAALASAGVRLDLVVFGDAPVPACLARFTAIDDAGAALADALTEPPHFHVETVGAEPAVVACSRAGGLPVAVEPGAAAVVVDLDPPLRVERDFTPDARLVLEVLDFPALDPPTRRWRWQAAVVDAGPPQ